MSDRFRLGSALLAAFFVSASLTAAVFPVTNTADAGAGSLRQAIQNANTTPGADTITFAIPGSGVHTIAPTSALPAITEQVTIDGTTQSGYAVGAPVIELSGASVPAGVDGLHVTGGNATILGIVINRFQPIFLGGGGNGILLETGGSNVVARCFIGTDPTGSTALGNGTAGISILNSSSNTLGGAAGGNLISGNGAGVVVNGTSNGNIIAGNSVGTNRPGGAALANSGDGISIFAGTGNRVDTNTLSGNAANGVSITGSATQTVVINNRIGTDSGGTFFVSNLQGVSVSGAGVTQTAITGNLVSGNQVNGIFVTNGATQTVIHGNFVGTDVSGNLGLGNGSSGVVVLTASTAQIGGPNPGDGNVISGNGTNGVRLRTGATMNVVEGNRIGTSPSGLVAIPNFADGVQVSDGSTQNVIGDAAAGNVISGNMLNGVRIADAASTGNSVENNKIGAKADGVTPLPNGTNGVSIENGASGNHVGLVLGNQISFNAGPGVSISSGNNNTVRLNSIVSNGASGIVVLAGVGNTFTANGIFGNAGLGIDLAPLGVTPNDADDSDTGPNNLLNFPILASATAAGGQTHVLGSLTSTPSTSFRIDFYASSVCDASGNGEGQFPLDTDGITVTTNSSGVAVIDTILNQPAMGPFITATAIDAAGDTSEFSPCVMLPGPTLSTVSPTSGPAGGGTAITLTGTGFQTTVTVAVGGVAATSPVDVDTTHATAVTPALAPGALYDVTLTNADLLSATLPKGWLADFIDVPGSHPFHSFVEKVVRASVTSGCGSGFYCVNDPVTRAQVAVFLLRSHDGPTYVPPPATGTYFTDVPINGFAAAWIEELSRRSVTAGCGGGNYCPTTPITRAQMAVFLLRTKNGAVYVPPPATGIFTDVPASNPFARWIEELFHEGIAGGCGGGNFCPDAPNTRGQMAVFLVTMFGL